jgi:hypothetical protein
MRAYLELPGYTLSKPTRERRGVFLSLGVRDADRQPIAAIYYASEPERAQAEYVRLRDLAFRGVARVLGAQQHGAGSVLLREHFEGVPLNDPLLRDRALVATFLAIAAQIADALSDIHALGLIHRRLTPAHLRVAPATLTTVITGIEHAEHLGSAGDSTRTTLRMLRYFAPEQTGRIGRGMDFRSDLYSLGASLYELLTGRPPFETRDRLSLIHAHIARTPEAPESLCSTIPRPLSRIVMTLLEKEPEDRYQSASALRADIEVCREHLARKGHVPLDLHLGESRTRGRPIFSPRLYGREQEAAELRRMYRAVIQAPAKLVLVTGPAGVGKSALASELRELTAASHGYVARGKFDPYQPARPYQGVSTALESLVQQRLTESDDRLDAWRRRLSRELGTLAAVASEFVPDLAFILPNLPAPHRLDSKGTQVRLSAAVKRFVHASASDTHPLVLVLDDIQWADDGSLSLLDALLDPPAARSLLVLATYREMDDAGRAAREALVQRLTRDGCVPATLTLAPISVAASTRMLSDTLGMDDDQTAPLAETIAQRTGNLPILIQQFVDHLYEQRLIRVGDGVRWEWSLAAIAAAGVPDDFVDLITPKIERLDSAARAALELASCLGDTFDVDALAVIAGTDARMVERALYALVEWGLVAPCSRGFQFVHDRVREAARSLLDAAARRALHLRIARLILERAGAAARGERILEVADHLAQAMADVPESERSWAVGVFLEAGERALESGAPHAAATYSGAARHLFLLMDPSERRGFDFRLAMHSAECFYQCNAFADALAALDGIETGELGRLQRLQMIAKRIQIYALERGPLETTKYTLEELRNVGVAWPLHPSRARVLLEMFKTEWIMRRRDPDTCLKPATKLHRDLESNVLIGPASASMVQVDQHITVLALCRSIKTFLRHGYSRTPGFTLAVYAAYRYLFWPNRSAMERFASAALVWNERVPEAPFRGRTLHFLYSHVYPWIRARRDSVEPLAHAAELLREDGDPEWASYTVRYRAMLRALVGDPVVDVITELREVQSGVGTKADEYPLAVPFEQLREQGGSEVTVQEMLFRTEIRVREAGGMRVSPQIHTLWMLVLCVHGDFALAFAESERIAETVLRTSPFIHLPDYFFLRALSAGVLATISHGRDRRRHRRVMRGCARRVAVWSRNNPDFAHMSVLLDAERANGAGRIAAALRGYASAAEMARARRYLHHAALAEERLAGLAQIAGRTADARAALQRAAELYLRWGATAKFEQLRRRAIHTQRAPKRRLFRRQATD